MHISLRVVSNWSDLITCMHVNLRRITACTLLIGSYKSFQADSRYLECRNVDSLNDTLQTHEDSMLAYILVFVLLSMMACGCAKKYFLKPNDWGFQLIPDHHVTEVIHCLLFSTPSPVLSTNSATTIQTASDACKHDLDSSPNLLTVRQNLLRRKDETVVTSVSQFDETRPLCT